MFDKRIIQFLQHSLHPESKPTYVPKSSEEWKNLYRFAQEQTLSGIIFDAISRLDWQQAEAVGGCKIPQPLLMKWMAEAEQIRRANIHLNKTAVQVYAQISGDGIPCCILKGQGNTIRYPKSYTRQPGDIDIWLDASRNEIERYAKEHFADAEGEILLLHISFYVDGVCVELHFVPSQANNPWYAHQLSKFFGEQAQEQCHHLVDLPDGAGQIAIPTTKFNLVYQLCHLKHHFFDEGLGLRQVVDYYYQLQHATAEDMPDERLLRSLGLWNFACAMMYVQREALGLEPNRMVAPVDEWRGKTLLAEILNAGNFGRYDQVYGTIPNLPKAKKFFVKTWRVLRFARQYPGESLVEPMFRLYHFGWRMWANHVKPHFS